MTNDIRIGKIIYAAMAVGRQGNCGLRYADIGNGRKVASASGLLDF